MPELVIPLASGMQLNKNKSATDALTFALLENVTPFEEELHFDPTWQPLAKAADKVQGGTIDGYFAWYSGQSKIYTFGVKIDKDIYLLNNNSLSQSVGELEFAGHLFMGVATAYSSNTKNMIGTQSFSDEEPGYWVYYTDYQENATLQFAPWVYGLVDTAYITTPGLPLTKIGSFTDDDGISHFGASCLPASYRDEDNKLCYLSAKYIIATNDRLFLGHCWEDDIYYPTRIHWSDINKPEDWAVSSTSEADYFDLGVNSLEITGLAYANAILYTFTKNAIWRSDYEGFESKFKTTKLTSATGNIYHYAVITVNEVVYFIGKDNFYCIDNTTITPIGDAIWTWFNLNKSATATTPIMAQYELKQKTITWIFPRKMSDGTVERWGLKYNTETGQWSLRDTQIKQ